MRRQINVALLSCALALPALANVIRYDFGDQTTPTPGNWNNFSHLAEPIFNSIDETGAATGIAVRVTAPFWPGSNQNGTTTPGGAAAGLPGVATRDNLFGNLVDFGGNTAPQAQLTISGLNPALTYDFGFFGSRMGVGDNRETSYTVTGANNGVGLLNTANNSSEMAFVNGIAPTANGTITVDVTAGANNTSANRFYYLGVMTINPVPAPAGAAALALVGLGLAGRRRR